MKAIPVIFIFFLIYVPVSLAGGLKPPPAPDSDIVARFCDQYPKSGIVHTQNWIGLDVRYKHQSGGLVGRYITVNEYKVQDRDYLEEISIQNTFQNPRFELKDFRVEILRGEETIRFKHKDLVWHEMTSRNDGVVTLDGTIAYALVPGVMVGDRIRVMEKYDLNGIFGLFSWWMGDPDTPYLNHEVELRLPKDYTLVWGGVGGDQGRERLKHSTTPDGGQAVHHWSLAAEQDGTLASCRDDYPTFMVVPHIAHAGKDHHPDISVGKDWASVGQAHLDHITDVFDSDESIVKLAAELVEGVTDPLEKIDRIYHEVQKRCRYLGLFEGAGGIIPIPAAEVLESGFGDCKGLGTLLIALLRECGFEAHPVLVRTSSAGRLDPSIPNMAQFNHYIAWVDTGDGGIFLDGTVEFCPAGLVPSADVASPVLLLKPGSIEMVEIPQESWFAGTSARQVEGRVDSRGMMELACEFQVTGNLGVRLRCYLDGRKGRKRALDIQSILLPEGIPMEAGKPALSGMDAWREPLTMNMTATSKSPLPGDGSGIFIPRQLTGTLLAFDPRLRCGTPVDLRHGPERRESWSIELPDEFMLARPDSLEIDSQGLLWSSRVWQEGTTLRLERSLRFSEHFVTSEVAADIRERVEDILKRDEGYLELRRR